MQHHINTNYVTKFHSTEAFANHKLLQSMLPGELINMSFARNLRHTLWCTNTTSWSDKISQKNLHTRFCESWHLKMNITCPKLYDCQFYAHNTVFWLDKNELKKSTYSTVCVVKGSLSEIWHDVYVDVLWCFIF